jgi:hypothetical protein
MCLFNATKYFLEGIVKEDLQLEQLFNLEKQPAKKIVSEEKKQMTSRIPKL